MLLAQAEPIEKKLSMSELLQAWNDGEEEALRHLMPRLYPDLCRMAERLLARHRADPILQPAVLVNELYLRFEKKGRTDWRDLEHFLAIAATEMRRIMLTHARRKQAVKRGFGTTLAALSAAHDLKCESSDRGVNALALETALTRLKSVDAEAGRIVEQRFFIGLSVPEVARTLGVTERTVYRRWAFAKAWLYDQLGGGS